MARRTILFDKNELTTYSQWLNLRLNEDLVNNAQIVIYAKNMADTTNLYLEQKLNSVITSLRIPDDQQNLGILKMMMSMAIDGIKDKKVLRCERIRLTSANFEKISQLADFMKTRLERETWLPSSSIDEQDRKFSIIINSVLLLFKNYDFNIDSIIMEDMR